MNRDLESLRVIPNEPRPNAQEIFVTLVAVFLGSGGCVLLLLLAALLILMWR